MEYSTPKAGFALKLLLVCALWLAAFMLEARVVINELFYNPVGIDTGYEWIELYNAGENDVNLEGCRILKAGAAFVEVFEFPRFILRVGRYVLVGESQVYEAQFTANLAFQNGGDATDGVRFESADGSYTDTILYDAPNLNQLTDDTDTIGSSFAPNPAAGYSLARIVNGWDSDDCAADFYPESNPTPGRANPLRIDFGLYWPELRQESGDWICSVWLKNLSSVPVSACLPLEFFMDGNTIGQIEICYVGAHDSLKIEQWTPAFDDQDHYLEILLDLPSDPVQANNRLGFWLLGQNEAQPIINEIMYLPASGFQEWIEIWHPIPASGSFRIRDRAGNSFAFQLPGECGYYVLCNDSERLLARYPDCPSGSVIQVSGWAQLNNDGDDLWLLDFEHAVIDSMSYAANATPVDYSLERFQNGEQVFWRASLSSFGATPGLANSTPDDIPEDQTSQLAVYGSPCKARAGEEIRLAFQLKDEQNLVSCKVWTRAGKLVRVLASNQLLPATGVLSWDGRDSFGKYVPRGLYHIQWYSKGQGSKKELSRKFSVAIRD